MVPVSQEVKDAYTAEAKAFASRLATQLQDAEGLSLASLRADTFYSKPEREVVVMGGGWGGGSCLK